MFSPRDVINRTDGIYGTGRKDRGNGPREALPPSCTRHAALAAAGRLIVARDVERRPAQDEVEELAEAEANACRDTQRAGNIQIEGIHPLSRDIPAPVLFG